MKGSASIEYALIAMVFALIYLSLVTYYTGELPFFADVKKLVEAKTELMRMAAAGYFVSTSEEANVALIIRDFGETIYTSPLRAIVAVSGNYGTCGGSNCTVSYPFSFDVNTTLEPGIHYVVKEGGRVKVK